MAGDAVSLDPYVDIALNTNMGEEECLIQWSPTGVGSYPAVDCRWLLSVLPKTKRPDGVAYYGRLAKCAYGLGRNCGTDRRFLSGRTRKCLVNTLAFLVVAGATKSPAASKELVQGAVASCGLGALNLP
jgi:hypothetical protein